MQNHDHNTNASESEHSELSFTEKTRKLLAHWVHHNEEHARRYDQWASACRTNGLGEAADLLAQAAALTGQINRALEQAQATIPEKRQ